MFFDVDTFFLLPPLWHVGMILLIVLSFEAIKRRHEYWALPALAVYGTIWLWYFPDMNVRWEAYEQSFDVLELDMGLFQLVCYIILFRVFLPALTRKFISHEEVHSRVPALSNADGLFLVVLMLWVAFLTIGIVTHGRGVIDALFPIAGRRSWSFMFGRSAVGGSFDWLISIAGNSYTILVVFLGLFIFLPKSTNLQYVNVFAYLISLPFFMFTGTRTAFIQVLLPVFLGYFLLSKAHISRKMAMGIAFFILANALMVTMIIYRNIGFEGAFSGQTGGTPVEVGDVFHDGANMLEELLFINRFQTTGDYPVQWFGNYMSELFQFIPRAYWPNKPLIVAELSILRGFTDGGGNQTGTVAMGKIGQGVVNVGPMWGPILAALLMASYCAWLCRLWVQGHSYLRTCLYIAGLCFIFNMGRNIGLLNLWPVVFGYCLVVAMEKVYGETRLPTRVLYTPTQLRINEPSRSQ